MTRPDLRHFELDRALLHRGGPTRAWGNLGDWSDARSYAEACEALAVRIGEAARLRSGDAVLDAACGEGEGLRVWHERFAVGCATGLDVHPRSVATANARVAGTAFEARASAELGDAVDLSRFPDEAFDAVVCVDAAYHFDTRRAFLGEALRVLRPGRRLALSDLVLDHEPRSLLGSAAVRRAARACAIPRANLVTEDAYLGELAGAGFEDLAIARLDVEVLEGFSSFIRGQQRAYTSHPGAGWRKLRVTAWVAGLAQRRRWLHYVVVSGSRKKP